MIDIIMNDKSGPTGKGGTMKRIALTDGSGRWFDKDKAEAFDEGQVWDGRNNISMATGQLTEHESLYRTVSGKWVLHSWSQYPGTMPRWEIVSDEFAAGWLITNEHDSDVIANYIAKLEI